MNEKIATAPTKYTIDLGNIWSEASVGGKQIYVKKKKKVSSFVVLTFFSQVCL